MKIKFTVSNTVFISIFIILAACKTTKECKKETAVIENKNIISDTIQINSLVQKDYNLKIGDILSYTGTEHPSVGSTFEYDLSVENANITDKKVLQFLEKKRIYKNAEMNNPNSKKPPMTGADEADVTLYFKVVDKGKVKLIISDSFRGRIEKQQDFKIIIE